MTYYVSADEKHKRKQRELARSLRSGSWWKSKLAQGICYYCENKFLQEELTMDHKVPISRGGESTRSNVAVSCKPCNIKKKHLTPAEMILGSEK